MIALLLDQGLAPGTAEILRQRGVDAIHVMEIGLGRAEDSEILAAARLQAGQAVRHSSPDRGVSRPHSRLT